MKPGPASLVAERLPRAALPLQIDTHELVVATRSDRRPALEDAGALEPNVFELVALFCANDDERGLLVRRVRVERVRVQPLPRGDDVDELRVSAASHVRSAEVASGTAGHVRGHVDGVLRILRSDDERFVHADRERHVVARVHLRRRARRDVRIVVESRPVLRRHDAVGHELIGRFRSLAVANADVLRPPLVERRNLLPEHVACAVVRGNERAGVSPEDARRLARKHQAAGELVGLTELKVLPFVERVGQRHFRRPALDLGAVLNRLRRDEGDLRSVLRRDDLRGRHSDVELPAVDEHVLLGPGHDGHEQGRRGLVAWSAPERVHGHGRNGSGRRQMKR